MLKPLQALLVTISMATLITTNSQVLHVNNMSLPNSIASASKENSSVKYLSEADKSADLLSQIYQKKKLYTTYNVDIIRSDFDGNDLEEFFFVFTEKDTTKKDRLDYCAEIWFGNELGVRKIVEWNYIFPDTYGCLKLAGKTYFRYDYAYPNESRTVLLSVQNGKCVKSFVAKGGANFSDDNTFTVTHSTYDMLYEKSYDYYCGHTWKDYYFYADDQGFHEYEAKKISKKTFQKYSNGDNILTEIKKIYQAKGTIVSFKFLKRTNGLIHINISCDTKNSIYYYFKTYKIPTDNSLKLIESGEGNYLTKLDGDLK